jgi:hypothetical protein
MCGKEERKISALNFGQASVETRTEDDRGGLGQFSCSFRKKVFELSPACVINREIALHLDIDCVAVLEGPPECGNFVRVVHSVGR